MKLVIYQAPKEEEKIEKTVFLKMVHVNNKIIIKAVNENGTDYLGGSLLSFENNGRITLHSFIDPKLGFDLDPAGRIKRT